MKKIYPLSFVFLLFIFSCKKEIVVNSLKPEIQLSVIELQKSLGKGFSGSTTSNNDDNAINRTPNWLKAYSLQLKSGSNILSVPLSSHPNDVKNGVKN